MLARIAQRVTATSSSPRPNPTSSTPATQPTFCTMSHCPFASALQPPSAQCRQSLSHGAHTPCSHSLSRSGSDAAARREATAATGLTDRPTPPCQTYASRALTAAYILIKGPSSKDQDGLRQPPMMHTPLSRSKYQCPAMHAALARVSVAATAATQPTLLITAALQYQRFFSLKHANNGKHRTV